MLTSIDSSELVSELRSAADADGVPAARAAILHHYAERISAVSAEMVARPHRGGRLALPTLMSEAQTFLTEG